jgi:hypothetical protein
MRLSFGRVQPGQLLIAHDLNLLRPDGWTAFIHKWNIIDGMPNAAVEPDVHAEIDQWGSDMTNIVINGLTASQQLGHIVAAMHYLSSLLLMCH